MVLILDDHKYLAETIKIFLDELNINSVIVTDSIEALELLAKREFRLLITDVNMPNMNGIDLIKSVRNLGLNLDIICMTGDQAFDDLKLQELGINRMLQKPFIMQDILDHVDKLFTAA